MKPFDYLVFGALGIAFVAVIYLMLSTHEGEADWEAFKREHQCRAVGETAVSNRSGWLCDDGKVHYRWRQQR